MSDLEMLINECKVIALEKIPEVMAINDQLEKWSEDARAELASMRRVIDAVREWRKERLGGDSYFTETTQRVLRAYDEYEKGLK